MFRNCVIFFICFYIALSSFANTYTQDGVIDNESGQVYEYAINPPPNNIKDLKPKVVQPVEPYNIYYNEIKDQHRRPVWMQPYINHYNTETSSRRYSSYTEHDFARVYCTGEVKGNRCYYDNEVIVFIKARRWGISIFPAIIRSMSYDKQYSLFVIIDNIAFDQEYLRDAKKCLEPFGIKIYAGTIDSWLDVNSLL